MAKVTGPLMSIEASGQFAESIVFDKRGFARGYTIPSNPRTNLQQATRLAMKAAQTAAKHLNATKRARLQELLGYRWNASLLSETLGMSLTNWNAANSEYETMGDGDRETVEALITTLNLPEVIRVPEYETPVTTGAAFYAVFLAYNRLIAPAAPVAVANISTLFT